MDGKNYKSFTFCTKKKKFADKLSKVMSSINKPFFSKIDLNEIYLMGSFSYLFRESKNKMLLDFLSTFYFSYK